MGFLDSFILFLMLLSYFNSLTEQKKNASAKLLENNSPIHNRNETENRQIEHGKYFPALAILESG